VLERLGEPISSLGMNPASACAELVRVRNAFIKEKKQISASMVDPDKLKAMKIMASLVVFYYSQRSVTTLFVSSRMVELTM
jgi:hypothetical protein